MPGGIPQGPAEDTGIRIDLPKANNLSGRCAAGELDTEPIMLVPGHPSTHTETPSRVTAGPLSVASSAASSRGAVAAAVGFRFALPADA